MYHQPPDNFLYAAYRIKTLHSDGIKSIEGIATGFLLEIGTGIPWIITNRHVIDVDYRKHTAKYKDFKLTSIEVTGRRPDDSEYTIPIVTNTSIFFHENYENDVAMILPQAPSTNNENFHWHFSLVTHLANQDVFKLISPFDVICFSGFPETHDKLMRRPILRCGTIASDPLYNYSWDKEDHGNCVAYEGFSTGGASGSPIFAPPRGLSNLPNSRGGYLIGVNAGHIPDTFGHSGISYFYKSTVINEIIKTNKLDELRV